jgi:alcohol dehydrogenase (cytochrome c)
MMNLKSTAVLTALAGALLASTAPLYAADVTFERLLNPEPHNWLMVHHDYGAQRFSKLETINKSNVKNMKLLFAVAIGGTSPNEALEATPLVEDGFMYVVDGWGAVYKIDVRSGTQGRILWKMDPGQEKYGRIRGVALWGNLVISTTGKDGRVIATDKETGKIVWDKNLHDQPEVELSSAPLALQGRHHRRRLRRRPGRARLDRLPRSENRQLEMEDLRHPSARRARQRNLEGQEQRLADRWRRVLRHRIL